MGIGYWVPCPWSRSSSFRALVDAVVKSDYFCFEVGIFRIDHVPRSLGGR